MIFLPVGKRWQLIRILWQTVTDLLESTQAMAEAFNNRALRLIQIQQDQDLALTQSIDDINNIATQIGELNAEIGRSQGAAILNQMHYWMNAIY